jgi:hypothetical protein
MIAIRSAGLAAAAVVFGLMAAPASASTAPTPTPPPGDSCGAEALAAAKSSVKEEVSARTAVLRQLSTASTTWAHLSSAHQSTISALISADTTGLATKNADAQASGTCTDVRAVGEQVVSDYRVYELVVPQVSLTISADSGLYGAGQLEATESALQRQVNKLPDGTTKDQAQALYDDLVIQVNTAQTDYAPVGDSLLTLTPAGYPDNERTVAEQGTQVAAGTKALGLAVSDVQKLETLLG